VPACGTGDAPVDDLDVRLEKDTGVAWGIMTDPRSLAPRVLSPAAPVRIGAGSAEVDARAFFERYKESLGAAGHELRVRVNEPEQGGGTYLRFEHYVPGTNLRVFDASSMVHFDSGGAVYLAQPGFRAGLDAIRHAAAITADAALRVAQAILASDCGIGGAAVPSSPPELGVATDEDAPLALAYRIPFREVTDRCLSPQVDIDATTGAVLRVRAGGAALTDHAGGTRFYVRNDKNDVKPLDITRHAHAHADDRYALETESSPKVITQNFQ